MRKALIVSILGLAFTATSAFAVDNQVAATAPAPAAALPIKIGVVDVRAVVQKSPQLQAVDAQLMRKFKPRQEKITQAQAQLKTEQDKYTKDAQTMSEADRTKLEHTIINDRANLQAMITAFQQDLDNEQNSAMQKLLSQAASVVNDIAKTEHYNLILQGDSVPYVDDSMNITDEVLKRLSDKA